MPILLGVAAGLLLFGGLVGVAVLFALASGTKGPRRFEVSAVGEDVTAYFDKSATWAATAKITVPGPAERVWEQLMAGGYMDSLPFVSGPARSGKNLSYRAVVIALSERIVRNDPGREFTAIGTGVSVPLLLDSFGERWVLTPSADGVNVSWTVAFTPQWIGWFPLRWTAFTVRPFLNAALKLAIR